MTRKKRKNLTTPLNCYINLLKKSWLNKHCFLNRSCPIKLQDLCYPFLDRKALSTNHTLKNSRMASVLGKTRSFEKDWEYRLSWTRTLSRDIFEQFIGLKTWVELHNSSPAGAAMGEDLIRLKNVKTLDSVEKSRSLFFPGLGYAHRGKRDSVTNLFGPQQTWWKYFRIRYIRK